MVVKVESGGLRLMPEAEKMRSLRLRSQRSCTSSDLTSPSTRHYLQEGPPSYSGIFDAKDYDTGEYCLAHFRVEFGTIGGSLASQKRGRSDQADSPKEREPWLPSGSHLAAHKQEPSHQHKTIAMTEAKKRKRAQGEDESEKTQAPSAKIAKLKALRCPETAKKDDWWYIRRDQWDIYLDEAAEGDKGVLQLLRRLDCAGRIMETEEGRMAWGSCTRCKSIGRTCKIFKEVVGGAACAACRRYGKSHCNAQRAAPAKVEGGGEKVECSAQLKKGKVKDDERLLSVVES